MGDADRDALTRRRFISTGMAAGSTLFLGACGSSGPSASKSANSGKALKMVHVPKFTTLPYFKRANEGMEKAAKELGATLKYTGPATANAEQQVASLTTVVTQKPDVIIVSAIEPDNVAPVLKRAMDRGITVVSYDADTQPAARDLYCNQLTYELAAKTYLDAALKDDPSGGGVAFMAATPTSANHIGQIKAMKALIAKGGKYGVFKPGKTYFVEDDFQKSVTTTNNIMQSSPEVKYVISGSAVSVPAAAQAIDKSDRRGKVWATGAALPGDIKKYLDDGSGKAFVLWDVLELGYMAAYAGQQIHAGKLKPAEGVSWTAGSLGKFEVSADNVSNYNRPLVFTKQNIAKYSW
jgi:rhamnose transport system substrate-binding protein